MSMVKVLAPDGWDFGTPPVDQIQLSSDGLLGGDLRRFIKRAGHYLADTVRKLEFGKGEVPLHFIAVGATEWFGPNKNGDGFREAVCRDWHTTFEKHAFYYYDHVNRDPKKSYGLIKKSLYNPEMHRIEVIVAANGTKEAARRNGGLVAERTLEKLASGKPIGCSMSCRVDLDECSWCGNKARHRREYCTEDSCGGGGLSRNMGTVLKCGHVLHADNPRPVFFDLSEVARPADRTAYATGLVDKLAEAVARGTMGGAQLAEELGMVLPDRLALEAIDQTKQASVLGFAVSEPPDASLIPAFVGRRSLTPPPTGCSPTTALSALVKEGVVLPPLEFLALITGDRTRAEASAPSLSVAIPSVLADLDSIPGDLFPVARSVSAPLAKWASRQAHGYSFLDRHVLRRLDEALLDGRASVRSELLVKAASKSVADAAAPLARIYLGYAFSSLAEIERTHPDERLTRAAFLTQNHVCRSI